MTENIQLIILPYTAVFFSIIARFIFMYLLYSKKSTNIYSLWFCGLSVTSSSIWIPYGIHVYDVPIIVRSGVEIILLSISGLYIIRNRYLLHEMRLDVFKSDIYSINTVLEKLEKLSKLDKSSDEYKKMYQDIIKVDEYKN